MSTSRSAWRAGVVGVAAGVVALAMLGPMGCEEQASPPPPSGNSGGSGPLSNLSEQPTSLPGRSAAAGRNAARQMSQEQSRAMGTAQEITGEAAAIEAAGLQWSVPSEWEKVKAS